MDSIWSTLRWVAMEVTCMVWEVEIPIFLVQAAVTLLLPLHLVSTDMAMVICLLLRVTPPLMVRYDFFYFLSFFSLAFIFRNPRTCDVYSIDRLSYHLFIKSSKSQTNHHLFDLHLSILNKPTISYTINSKRLLLLSS